MPIAFAILLSLSLLSPLANADAGGACGPPALIIAIDIGHTPKKPGAVSARGIPEYNFNLTLAYVLYRELVAHGFTAYLINAAGAEISLAERARIANRQGGQLLLSIHHDSVQPHYLSNWLYGGKQRQYSDTFKGYSLFISARNPFAQLSRAFADSLGYGLLAAGMQPTLHHAEPVPGENRELLDRSKGIYRFNELAILKIVKMPAVLIEGGIIVNRQEEYLVQTRLYQQKITSAIVRALCMFQATR